MSDGLRLADALIASTAVVHGLVLVSANGKHFKGIDGLALQIFEP